jgi:two-component system, NarL family, invasion response regulator UvrY
MIDVIVCDDHPVLRQGLARIIQNNLEVRSIREADGGQTLLDLLREKPADVILLDVGLPGRGGLEVLRQIKEERPRQPVLMLSVHPANQYAVRALRAGASGYLTKDLPVDELIKAVRTAAGGHRYVTPEVAERLADDLDRPAGKELHELLSDREFEVLCLMGSGKTVAQIANDLCRSYNTISTYRSRILVKLRLKTDTDLVRYALQHCLVE